MKPARPRYSDRNDPSHLAPLLGFAGAIFIGAAVSAGLVANASREAVMPALATILLIFAAGFSLIAWRGRAENSEQVTYADVAGALTLIGLFAACTIDPDQLLRIVDADLGKN